MCCPSALFRPSQHDSQGFAVLCQYLALSRQYLAVLCQYLALLVELAVSLL